jgi:uncharacterized protein
MFNAKARRRRGKAFVLRGRRTLACGPCRRSILRRTTWSRRRALRRGCLSAAFSVWSPTMGASDKVASWPKDCFLPTKMTSMNDSHPILESRWMPIVLLICSNVFMTVAWYGHLRFRHTMLWKVMLVSWSIAFFEYVLQVPANRYGSYVYTPAQLKIIQEVVTLCVFSVFAFLYLGQKLQWNNVAAFLCLVAAVAFTFLPKN